MRLSVRGSAPWREETPRWCFLAKTEPVCGIRSSPLAAGSVAAGREDTGALPRSLMSVLKPPLVRALLQEYGTEVRRADDPRDWGKKVAGGGGGCRPQRRPGAGGGGRGE